MSNNKDEEEVWKTYPDYDFIEVSNLGMVRTKDRYVTVKGRGKRLVKGRILKQHLTKDGYVYVAFGMNCKRVFLYVHRMVAIRFLPNPNNYPEVNHKDNDPINNIVSNLEWCTREYNIAYKEKYGKSAAQVSGCPVFAVNLETCKILWFETQHEAARQLGVSQGDIYSVLKGIYNQTGGYWFTEDESEITEEKIQEIKSKTNFRSGVIAINPETSAVFWFESQSEAGRQLRVNVGHMNEVIKSKRNKAGGYWFCYADENAVEKVRARFGGEIAKKVEELMKQNK